MHYSFVKSVVSFFMMLLGATAVLINWLALLNFNMFQQYSQGQNQSGNLDYDAYLWSAFGINIIVSLFALYEMSKREGGGLVNSLFGLIILFSIPVEGFIIYSRDQPGSTNTQSPQKYAVSALIYFSINALIRMFVILDSQCGSKTIYPATFAEVFSNILSKKKPEAVLVLPKSPSAPSSSKPVEQPAKTEWTPEQKAEFKARREQAERERQKPVELGV